MRRLETRRLHLGARTPLATLWPFQGEAAHGCAGAALPSPRLVHKGGPYTAWRNSFGERRYTEDS